MFSLILIWNEWSFFILRLILGFLMIVHGWPKIKNLKGTAEWMSSQGFKPGIFWAVVSALVEFIGGIFLIFGFLTQIVALLLTIQFLVIVLWRIKKHEGLIGEFELDLIILGASIVLLLNGAGALSLDKFFGIF
jgi:putative oxidoreductase